MSNNEKTPLAFLPAVPNLLLEILSLKYIFYLFEDSFTYPMNTNLLVIINLLTFKLLYFEYSVFNQSFGFMLTVSAPAYFFTVDSTLSKGNTLYV